jgi:hypothetical protein
MCKDFAVGCNAEDCLLPVGLKKISAGRKFSAKIPGRLDHDRKMRQDFFKIFWFTDKR